jgi:ABC-type transport system involved in multi-copper enzyme maturation permease subunit
MRFLSVADRELRSAARQKATYRTRWITAALFFALLVWLLWVFNGFPGRGVAPKIFNVFSVLTFLYCLFLGTARTADCISAERREGTLGLLFLTNLNSAEIIAGKLCSTALASVYGMMAVFPMLALPLLMGGITFGQFGRTVVGLLNGILSALAAGFLASVICKKQFTAIALALGLMVSVAGGLLLGAAVANSYGPTKPLAHWLADFSPLYTLVAADGLRIFGANRFWQSAVAVAGMSIGCLGLTMLLLAGTWRDRPKSVLVRDGLKFWRRTERAVSANRVELRRRLLAINPMFWLAGRQPVSAPAFMALALVLTLITVYVAAPYFGHVIGAGTASPVAGHLFAWLWAGAVMHALVLYYAAMAASQRLAEDKQMGALELILCTPTTDRTISRGLWLAYGRKMLFPALLAVLVHVFFLWMCMVMASLDPPGAIAPGAPPGEIFWSALLDKPLRGRMIDWQFGFMLRCALLILMLLMLAWLTLGWVGRWLGLRMKHAGFAPMASLALLLAPPMLLFSLACYLAEKLHLTRMPDRLFLPLMMWLAVAIGVGHCLMLSVWAGSSLRNNLRTVALSRYQPLPAWRWQLPNRRAVRRFAIAAAVFVTIVALLLAGSYGYRNWRSKRAWQRFQTTLKRSDESLSLAPLLPEPAPTSANFARLPAFLGLMSNTNLETTSLFQRLRGLDIPTGGPQGQGSLALMEWSRQTNALLLPFVNMTGRKSRRTLGPKRQDQAAAILEDLQSQSGALRELAAAAARLPAFQTSTNRTAYAVLHPLREPILTLERLHLLFQLRACALLAMGRNAEAADDLLTGLRLAQLARQIPDTQSTMRVQTLLVRSLQPLWEGLNQHAWTEPQLASIQHELARFDLLADYTNAVRRVVLAHIEIWRAIPESTNAHPAFPDLDGRADWQLQPRAWWLDSCRELHNVGLTAIAQVDGATGRFESTVNWSDLDGLPLDGPSRELLQESLWWGANPSVVAFAQTSVNQAIISCALERFRLAKGVYPQSLDELVPALLDRVPHDAISGRPMIYQPPAQGNFILRGVGPNGIDDRKKAASDDWLWTYPTNGPSAK